MKKLTLSIVAAASVLIPVGASAFGIGFYYVPSIPLNDVEPLGAETYELSPCFSGFGVKFWKHFHPMVAIECYGGYSPSYVSDNGDEGKFKLGTGAFGVRFGKPMGVVEPYGSVGIGVYYRDIEFRGATSALEEKGAKAGVYFGGGVAVDLAGPLRFDINPVYLYVPSMMQSYNFFDIRTGMALMI